MEQTREKKVQNSKFCVFAILVTQLPIAVLMGLHLTALNSSTPAIKVFINASYQHRYAEHPSEELISFILTFAQSIVVWGSLVGAIMVKYILERFSRKGAVLLVHGLNVFSIILMAPITKYGQSYEALIIGRFIAGISRGLGFSIIMVVVAETTCRRRMGFFQSPFAVLIFVGCAIGAGLGHPAVLGTPEHWSWINCTPAIPSLIYFMSFPWLPNTPVYLLKCGRRDDALDTLKKLRVGDEVQNELDIIQDEINEESNVHVIPLKTILKDPSLRLQFFTALVIEISPQLTGLQAIFMYSDSLLLQAGVDTQYVTFVTMAMFLQIIIGFAIYIPVQRKFGTKRVFLVGLVITTIGYIIFTIANGLHKTLPWMSYIALAFMCFLLFGIQFGPLISMHSLPAELTTASSRPTVALYSGCMYWTLAGIISFVIPYSVAAWGAYAYIPFIVLSMMLVPFAVAVIPETHKRSAARIQSSFTKKSMQSTSELFSLSKRSYEVKGSNPKDNEAFDNAVTFEI